MGAIRPPWTSKQEFYRLPFNFCDRWCEHCDLTSICNVYKEGQKDRKKALREGKDPDSMEFAFEVVHKNLQKSFKLLYRGAKRWGIDLNEIEKDPKDDDWDKEVKYHNDLLYKPAVKLNKRIYEMLEKLEYVSNITNTDILKREAEIISWYNPLIVAKIARALSSYTEESNLPEDLKSYDDKTSAFIAYWSLEKMSKSLLNLSRQKGLLITRKKFFALSNYCLILRELLNKKFQFIMDKDFDEN